MFPGDFPVPTLKGFELLQRLGAGGAGEVFLARSRGGRLVAIKVLLTHGVAEKGDFAREASLCARLRHPAIVQVRAFLEEAGVSALVFEYVPGVALARLIRVCAARRVRLPDRPAWHVVERVLAALAHAHGLRDDQQQPTPIVHRDVSPSNVLVDWEGGVKLSDFGLAKMIGVSPATRVGLVKGTPGCMAPEQAKGEAVTERADVYAAGLLAWRLATGRTPFAKAKDEFDMLRAMRSPRIKPLHVLRPELPEGLLEGIAAALEPSADQRTIRAAELGAIVRKHVDVDRGERELADILARWRGPLERTVKRVADQDVSLSGEPLEHTLRYAEVALAFDDQDVGFDGPTFDTHALPSDAAIPTTLPAEPGASSPAPPPALPPLAAGPSPPPTGRAEPADGPPSEPIPPFRRGNLRWAAASLAALAVLGVTVWLLVR